MRLSKNFVLSEFTRSNTAKRLGIENEPNKRHIQNIQDLVTQVLQPIRSGIGSIRITSGSRSPQLSKAIGSSSRSQHCKGQAADIQYWENSKINNKVIYDYIIDLSLIHI